MIHGELPEDCCSLGIAMQPLPTPYLKAGKEVTHSGKEFKMQKTALVSASGCIRIEWKTKL